MMQNLLDYINYILRR